MTTEEPLHPAARERREQQLAVIARDGHLCVWCGCETVVGGNPQATIEHIVPRRHSGDRHSLANMTVACAQCNANRHDRDLAEFYGCLRRGRGPRSPQQVQHDQLIDAVVRVATSSCDEVARIYARRQLWLITDLPQEIEQEEMQRAERKRERKRARKRRKLLATMQVSFS